MRAIDVPSNSPGRNACLRSDVSTRQAELLARALKERPYLQDLAERLLSMGGRLPCIWNGGFHAQEFVVNHLLESGAVTSGEGSKLRKMRPSSCHENAMNLADKYPHLYEYETGYALSDDGMWRPHSWARSIKTRQIIETTVPRVKYFGVEFPTDAALDRAAHQRLRDGPLDPRGIELNPRNESVL